MAADRSSKAESSYSSTSAYPIAWHACLRAVSREIPQPTCAGASVGGPTSGKQAASKCCDEGRITRTITTAASGTLTTEGALDNASRPRKLNTGSGGIYVERCSRSEPLEQAHVQYSTSRNNFDGSNVL